MIVQNIEIESSTDIRELYVRTDGKIEGKSIQLQKNQQVTFDTYVNMFSTTKWRKYTELSEVYLQIVYKGHCIIKLCIVENNGKNKSTIMRQELISAEVDTYISNSFKIEKLGEICYIAVEALDDSVVMEASYCTDMKETNDLKLACGICTYKREAELKQNLDEFTDKILNNNSSPLNDKLDIYIADNGSTIDSQLYGNEHIKVFSNKNYGGSAGFTRSLIEAKFNSGIDYTNVLLLDDDAQTKAYSLERLAVFLMLMKEQYKGYLVGGALMALEKPTLMMEQEAVYTHDKLALRKQFLDVADRNNVLLSEIEEVSNYNGWFFACLPADVIREDNLPLPFFLHGDDIEYGFQFNNNIIHMNGICVWHPNPMFRGQQRDYVAYYDTRNYMIINSCYYPRETMLRLKSHLIWKVMASVATFRYDRAWYIIRGYEDFAKGLDWLKDQNAEALNRDIIEWKKAEKCVLQDEVIELLDGNNIVGWQLLTLINWLIPSWKIKNVNAVGYKYKINYLGVKEVRWVNTNTNEGIVLKKNYKELFRVLFALLNLSVRINNRAIKQYSLKRLKTLKSLDFWRKYLEI